MVWGHRRAHKQLYVYIRIGGDGSKVLVGMGLAPSVLTFTGAAVAMQGKECGHWFLCIDSCQW